VELLEVQKEADSAGRKALIFGIIGMSIAATFGYLLSRFGGGTPDSQPVVVASHTVAALTTLKAADLTVVSWPRNALPEGIISDMNQILGSPHVNVNELLRNEPVLAPRLSAAEGALGVSALIETEKRAFVVQVNEAIATSMILHPGCVVDVVATLQDPRTQSTVSKTILQNVKVLAVGDSVDVESQPLRTGGGEPRGENHSSVQRHRVVTLSVTLSDVEILSYATTQGRIDLAMRSNSDTEVAATAGVSTEKLLGSLKEDSDARDHDRDRGGAPALSAPQSTPPARTRPHRAPRNSGFTIYKAH
jgi:pilus assembly protein CpaB